MTPRQIRNVLKRALNGEVMECRVIYSKGWGRWYDIAEDEEVYDEFESMIEHINCALANQDVQIRIRPKRKMKSKGGAK